MKKLQIGSDLDDTIFDFSKGYINRFKKFPNCDWAITRNVTHILSKERDFWINLPLKRRPNFDVTLYCSSRVNRKAWTKKSLEINDLPKAPLYQIPGYNISKARYIKGRIDVFIEDSPFQWKTLNQAGVPCLLMDAPYNQHLGPMLRIHSLDYDEIEEVYYLAEEMDVFKEFNLYYNGNR